MSQIINEHKWLKDKTGTGPQVKKRGIEHAWEEAEDLGRFSTHIVAFFKDRVMDYSIMKPAIVKTLAETSRFFKKCHNTGSFIEMVDPSAQYLEQCIRIVTPRFSGTDQMEQ